MTKRRASFSNGRSTSNLRVTRPAVTIGRTSITITNLLQRKLQMVKIRGNKQGQILILLHQSSLRKVSSLARQRPSHSWLAIVTCTLAVPRTTTTRDWWRQTPQALHAKEETCRWEELIRLRRARAVSIPRWEDLTVRVACPDKAVITATTPWRTRHRARAAATWHMSSPIAHTSTPSCTIFSTRRQQHRHHIITTSFRALRHHIATSRTSRRRRIS